MAEAIPDFKILDELHPVKELDREKRAGLAQRSQFADLRQGQRLDASQEHRWLVYLLEGSVSLLDEGETRAVAAGSTRARQPLFSEGRFKEQAEALTGVRLLRVDRRVFEILQQQQSQSGYEVEDVELDDTEGALFAEVYEACASGKVDLPALPEIAIKIQAAMKDPDVDIARLARIVGMDLAVTGGLIRAASSAAYGSANPVKSVRDAIVRLGLTAARRLAITIAMQQVFQSKSPALRRRMQELGDRSVRVSVLSFVMARHCAGFDPEHALLAGLLHDVGSVPVLDYLGRNHPEISDREIDAIAEKLRGVVGELVVGSWNLGPDISMVVRESGDWKRDQQRKTDYCDIVLVARLYHLNQAGSAVAVPSYHEVPAFAKLGLVPPNQDGKLAIIEDAQNEMREMMAVIKGGV
jgi:HD-like signal output (HDOD) protein